MTKKHRTIEIMEEYCNKLIIGEISYTSLPRKLKKEYTIIVNSNFEDVLESAPLGFWKNKEFIKAVLRSLDRESIHSFNEEHYIKLIEKVKKYNKADSNVWRVIYANFSASPNKDKLFSLL